MTQSKDDLIKRLMTKVKKEVFIKKKNPLIEKKMLN